MLSTQQLIDNQNGRRATIPQLSEWKSDTLPVKLLPQKFLCINKKKEKTENNFKTWLINKIILFIQRKKIIVLKLKHNQVKNNV